MELYMYSKANLLPSEDSKELKVILYILHFKGPDNKRYVAESHYQYEEQCVEWSVLKFALEWKQLHVLHVLLFAQLFRVWRRPPAVVVVQPHKGVALHKGSDNGQVVQGVGVGTSEHFAGEGVVHVGRSERRADQDFHHHEGEDAGREQTVGALALQFDL